MYLGLDPRKNTQKSLLQTVILSLNQNLTLTLSYFSGSVFFMRVFVFTPSGDAYPIPLVGVLTCPQMMLLRPVLMARALIRVMQCSTVALAQP